MNALSKLQKQPEHIRKIIFWIILVVSAIVLFFFWLGSAKERLQNFNAPKLMESTGIPELELPSIDIPQELKQ